MTAEHVTVADEQRPPSPHSGRVATGIGVLFGAHVGIVVGAIVGTFAYFPFRQPSGTGGWDVLIGSFFGAMAGVVIGGTGGAALGLRAHRHRGRKATIAVVAAMLLCGLVPFFLVLQGGSDRELSGWWYVIAFEGPILLAALLARPLTYRRPAE